MTIKDHNTAILVFIRDAKQEAKHKVFVDHIGIKGNQELASTLNKRVIKLCRKTGIPTFVHSNQEGSGFGNKIANAFESIFSQGFENVIAVGNDCLAISKETLRNAKKALNQRQMVLGPAVDGGLYLIGLSKSAYKRKQFVNFDWTTEKLSQDFLNFANQYEFSVELFETAIDIDNESDFNKVLESLTQFNPVKKRLEKIIHFVERILIVFNKSIKLLFYLKYPTSLRAPPYLLRIP